MQGTQSWFYQLIPGVYRRAWASVRSPVQWAGTVKVATSGVAVRIK